MIDGQDELYCKKCTKNNWKVTSSKRDSAILLVCVCGNKVRIYAASDGYETCIIDEGECIWEYEFEFKELQKKWSG